MLKISIHDTPTELRFQLEGRLIGPWVAEAEGAWQTAESARNGRRVVFDLSDITFIDDNGRELLERLHRSDVTLLGSDPMTRSIIEEVTGLPAQHRRQGDKCRRLIRFHGALPAIVAMLLANGVHAAEPLKLTLRDAVQTALKQNPQVAIAGLNIAQAQENANLSRSALLPQAGISANDAVRRVNIQAQIGVKFAGFPQHVGPFWAGQAGVGFEAPLVDLAAYRRYKASKENIVAARSDQASVREEYVFLVVSQYLGSQRAAADVKAARSRADLAKALLDLSTDLLKSGVGTRIDTLRAEVQYQNERQRQIESDTQLQTSLFGLGRLLNLDPAQSIELVDAVGFFETPAFNAEQSLEAAYRSRPELQALEARTRTLEVQRQAASDQRLPKLSVSGGWAEQGLTLNSMIPAYSYQASVEGPLYTGGRIRAQQAIADIELKKIAQNRQELRNRIALEVKTAAAQLDSARSQVEVANRAVQLAGEEVSQARDRFTAGVANNIEVITAQDGLARASDNQIVALYRYNQARADLSRATGQIESLYGR